jgi:hypothetical protein
MTVGVLAVISAADGAQPLITMGLGESVEADFTDDANGLPRWLMELLNASSERSSIGAERTDGGVRGVRR